MLGLAKRVKARILLASTSEIYGDPEVHPQPEVSLFSIHILFIELHKTDMNFIIQSSCKDILGKCQHLGTTIMLR